MRRRGILAAVLFLSLAVSAAEAATIIKLGSLAPVGSPWELLLKRVAAEWQRVSGGAVTVRIYAGGVAGDEPDMVRKMRIGTLNAGLMTVSGLQGIFDGVKTLSYPLLIRNDAELSYVLGKMAPFFDQELQKRGFKPVLWATSGWVYFFSRFPVVTPDDLRRQKLWVWSGDPDEIQAYQNAGFQTVTIASTDLLTSLQGGMVDALVTSPLIAASNQWFGIVNNMCALKLGPLWGAAVVTTKTWAEIPPALQQTLIDSAQKIVDAMEPDIEKADGEAISVMQKYGLKIHAVPAAVESQWAELLQRTFSGLVGKMYDRQSFEMVSQYLAEYRATHP